MNFRSAIKVFSEWVDKYRIRSVEMNFRSSIKGFSGLPDKHRIRTAVVNFRSAIKDFTRSRWLRYSIIIIFCLLMLSPFLFIPQIFNQDDLCGGLCIRRFYLIFPGMGWDDFIRQVRLAAVGVGALLLILIVTFFFGRLWCGYICPMGGFPELVSRLFHDRWKIDYRVLPQVPIRYGYFITYLVILPAVGFSACTLCNFITIPRIFEIFGGGARGIAYLISTVGAVNLALVVLLGFFAKLGRGYCQFLCPVGAIDGIVNRLGAKLSFVQRVRIERSRCTGCRVCAEVCIAGAIRMEDHIAVVDQLSCLACRECVIICDWGAIDWLRPPSQKMPLRLKKGIKVAPPAVWTAVAPDQNKSAKRADILGRILLGCALTLVLLLIFTAEAAGGQRQTDPDGCLACHAILGLSYVDDNGVIRDSSILPDHYAGSIHGSVPCKDCHRQIKEYPHKVENGEVDCSESCHLEEPSEEEAYTHQPIVEEMQASAHGEALYKGFSGANRIKEERNDAVPSCRRCHSNTLYIPEDKMPFFKEAMGHGKEACGDCHQGEVWQKQIGGHILRRLIGVRWTKQEEVNMCKECHSDREAMSKVVRQDTKSGEKKLSNAHFVLAGDSYDMGLHGRLVAAGNEYGVTCIDCHAPDNYRHAILTRETPESSTHPDNLKQTCSAEGCHTYAANALNQGFLNRDVHDLDTVPAHSEFNPLDKERLDSNWFRSLVLLSVPLAVFVAGSLWSLFSGEKRGATPILGGIMFEQRMLKKKPKTTSVNSREDRMQIDRIRKTQWLARFRSRRKQAGTYGSDKNEESEKSEPNST